MTALAGLPLYLYLLHLIPARTMLTQLFPFWLARIYHSNPFDEPRLLFLPGCSLVAFLLILFKPSVLQPYLARKPYREVTAGFFLFAFLLGARGLQGSWFAQVGPPYLAISALLAIGIRGVVRFVSPRFASLAAQAAFLLFFLRCVFHLMNLVIEYRIDLPWTVQTPRMAHARFLRMTGEKINQTMRFVKRNGHSRYLVALPYMPAYNFVTEMDSPIHRIFYLPGFLSEDDEQAAIRRLEAVRGAWVLISNQYDEGQLLGFRGWFFGKNYDRLLWSYLERNYVTCAVWRGDNLEPVPGTPVKIEELAILAPRSWHIPDALPLNGKPSPSQIIGDSAATRQTHSQS
jgi:hypothetical protein